MYSRFEKGLHPRQSATEYLMAVKEETQQLEEELVVLEEVVHAILGHLSDGTCLVQLFVLQAASSLGGVWRCVSPPAATNIPVKFSVAYINIVM